MAVTARIDSVRGKSPEDGYLALVRELPLRPIRSEAELDRAIAMVNVLGDREALTPAEHDYLLVLSDLIEKYEDEQYPIPAVCRGLDPALPPRIQGGNPGQGGRPRRVWPNRRSRKSSPASGNWGSSTSRSWPGTSRWTRVCSSPDEIARRAGRGRLPRPALRFCATR